MEAEIIYPRQKSEKDFALAVLLCFFLGIFGIHRFYTGKLFTGFLMLITGGGFGIWCLIDFCFLITGNFKDGDGLLMKN